MACVFGHYYNTLCTIGGECPYCWAAYKAFCKNLPPSWRQYFSSTGPGPTFYEWQEEQIIKRDLQDGIISHEEAMRRVNDLKEKLRRTHKPTQEEIAEARRQRATREAAKPKTVFDLPSLF